MKERPKEPKSLFSRVLAVISGKPESDAGNQEDDHLIPNDSDPLDVRFAKRFTSGGGKFIYCSNRSETEEILSHISSELNLCNVFSPSPVSSEILSGLKHPFKLTELENAGLFVTDCEALVAYNGGLMITSIQKGGKTLEQLPKDVIVFGYTDQLVDKLNEGLSVIREKYKRNIPTQIGTIHGPKKQVQAEDEPGRLSNLFLVLTERPG